VGRREPGPPPVPAPAPWPFAAGAGRARTLGAALTGATGLSRALLAVGTRLVGGLDAARRRGAFPAAERAEPQRAVARLGQRLRLARGLGPVGGGLRRLLAGDGRGGGVLVDGRGGRLDLDARGGKPLEHLGGGQVVELR
jgi:hypothetical protein